MTEEGGRAFDLRLFMANSYCLHTSPAPVCALGHPPQRGGHLPAKLQFVAPLWDQLQRGDGEQRRQATSTFAPTDNPINILVNKFIIEPFEPTAANEFFPANRPTTTTSAALKNNCNTLDAISGNANNNNLFKAVKAQKQKLSAPSK